MSVALGAKAYLRQQREGYLKHKQVVDRAKATLDHQYRLQKHEIIPKKHLPKPPMVVEPYSNKTHTKKFTEEYKKLFLRSLQDAIIQNTTILELEKARCLDVLRQTEQVLTASSEPPVLLSKWYKQFLNDINAKEHTPCPELRKKLEAATPITQGRNSGQRPRETRKRKAPNTNKPVTKQQKLDHFLVKGLHDTQSPT